MKKTHTKTKRKKNILHQPKGSKNNVAKYYHPGSSEECLHLLQSPLSLKTVLMHSLFFKNNFFCYNCVMHVTIILNVIKYIYDKIFYRFQFLYFMLVTI